jgi:hypothetical protein
MRFIRGTARSPFHIAEQQRALPFRRETDRVLAVTVCDESIGATLWYNGNGRERSEGGSDKTQQLLGPQRGRATRINFTCSSSTDISSSRRRTAKCCGQQSVSENADSPSKHEDA